MLSEDEPRSSTKDVKFIRKNNETWMWPRYDEKLFQVFDQVEDIKKILPHVTEFRECVQAGGACGVWPHELAKHFDTVHTFEPDITNYSCLIHNTLLEGVMKYKAALGSHHGTCDLALDDSEKNNCGAIYTKEGTNCIVETIDSLDLDHCGLIQLDIEGAETFALMGAMKTILKCSPVIVVEEKQLPHIKVGYKSARLFIEALGYREVGRMNRDVIFKIK